MNEIPENEEQYALVSPVIFWENTKGGKLLRGLPYTSQKQLNDKVNLVSLQRWKLLVKAIQLALDITERGNGWYTISIQIHR